VSYVTAICGVTEVTILAWFHDEKKKQEVGILEWVLVSVIGVIWLGACVWIVFVP
jgi:hypothetical protein